MISMQHAWGRLDKHDASCEGVMVKCIHALGGELGD